MSDGVAAKTLLSASFVLLLLTLAGPAMAEDFKLGIGGGAALTTGTYAHAYKSGWLAAVRALWFPSGFFIGVRAAGSYGQNPPKAVTERETSTASSALWGVDVSAAIRLTGRGADGLYLDTGIGSRSFRREVPSPAAGAETRTDSNISYNAGAGFSTRWFFVEAGGVYFRVQGTNVISIPLTVGFQF